jgi:hypothetical protein
MTEAHRLVRRQLDLKIAYILAPLLSIQLKALELSKVEDRLGTLGAPVASDKEDQEQQGKEGEEQDGHEEDEPS